MITFYRICLWFAEFDLAMAEATGSLKWRVQSREDVAHWRGELDRAWIRERPL